MRSGRWMVPLFALGASNLIASPSHAQVARSDLDTTEIAVDPDDALGAARAAQAAFELARSRHLPARYGSTSSDPCDEVVGRFCTWHDEGEWVPEDEPEELRALRADLVAELDSLQTILPSDSWVLGQRVWYRAEGGDWDGALDVARGCLPEPTWWCSALEGLALHGLGRFVDAEAAFDTALARMDPERALEWRVPERAVDGLAREVLATVRTAAGEPLEIVLERLWWLADPLFLVEGNDRKTAHFARWTVATVKEDARNPYRMRWGRDLEELTVRHGWEVGWERIRRAQTSLSQLGRPDDVVGHKEPEGRDYLPDGRTLADPTTADAENLIADRSRPRSLYTPPYAPLLLPMGGQLARFPRGDRLLIVASIVLPEDTTVHATHDHPRPWLETGDQAGMPDRIGLFAVPVDGGAWLSASRVGSAEGELALEVPEGAWLISSESWSPERRRAGRHRVVLEHVAPQPGAAILSDLLLLSPSERVPASAEETLPDVLPTAEIAPGTDLRVAWEMSGLGYRPETLELEVTVERTGRGVFRRLGELLRLVDSPTVVAIGWDEPGPERPGPAFRYLDLAFPELGQGRYRVEVKLRTQGRTEAVAEREFLVR